jgi:eukaryotic-like serine/threonine-protein kinase
MSEVVPATVPSVLGNYEVLDKIAEGSMSLVHKGRNRSSGAAVAIKILSPECVANEVLRQRFFQEFRAASLLRHPNLVRAIDGGQQDGVSFLVMEYVAGEDLWQRIERDGPLPEAEAVRIISQVTEALEAAHAQGIIHRDVKPDNVLLTTKGQVKLADLGLAKDLSADIDLTRPDQGLGTPNFIAPEQFGDAKHAGVRCDVYGAGATLYMAVTGQLPFPANCIPAVLKKKINNDLVPPRQLVRGLSERIDFAIRRALRANPKERQASCREFRNALNGQSDGEVAPPPAAHTPAATAAASSSRAPVVEQRVSVRFSYTLPTRCSRNTSIHPEEVAAQDCWEATIQDLSDTGMGILVNRRFEPGTVLIADLRSSNKRFERNLEIRVTRVRRSASGFWFHGCVFAEPLSKEELRKVR